MEDQDYELALELALAELDDESNPETFFLALNTALERLKAYGSDLQARA